MAFCRLGDRAGQARAILSKTKNLGDLGTSFRAAIPYHCRAGGMLFA